LDFLALEDVLGVEVFDLFLLVQLHFELFFLCSFFVGETFGKVVPFELCQVFDVPYVLGVEVVLLLDHLLAVKSECRQLRHPLIGELNPPLLKANPLIASILGPTLGQPLAFLQQKDPLHTITVQQLSDVVGFHVGWDSR